MRDWERFEGRHFLHFASCLTRKSPRGGDKAIWRRHSNDFAYLGASLAIHSRAVPSHHEGNGQWDTRPIRALYLRRASGEQHKCSQHRVCHILRSYWPSGDDSQTAPSLTPSTRNVLFFPLGTTMVLLLTFTFPMFLPTPRSFSPRSRLRLRSPSAHTFPMPSPFTWAGPMAARQTGPPL
jgi:hypothetical protein